MNQREKSTWWIVPPENVAKIAEIMRPVQEDTATMSESEINAVIDEALAEVRSHADDRDLHTTLTEGSQFHN